MSVGFSDIATTQNFFFLIFKPVLNIKQEEMPHIHTGQKGSARLLQCPRILLMSFGARMSVQHSTQPSSGIFQGPPAIRASPRARLSLLISRRCHKQASPSLVTWVLGRIPMLSSKKANGGKSNRPCGAVQKLQLWYIKWNYVQLDAKYRRDVVCSCSSRKEHKMGLPDYWICQPDIGPSLVWT